MQQRRSLHALALGTSKTPRAKAPRRYTSTSADATPDFSWRSWRASRDACAISRRTLTFLVHCADGCPGEPWAYSSVTCLAQAMKSRA